MPKRLSNKDKKHIYCAYKVGEYNNKTRYTNEIYTFECQFTRFNGVAQTNIQGRDISYVATAIFENTENTRYINEFCQFWQSTKPDNGNMVGEYIVSGMTEVVDGLFTVYLNKKVQNNTDFWVLADDNKIYQIQGLYDEETKTLIVPRNTFTPISFHCTAWDVEPDPDNLESNAMDLIFKEETNNGIKFVFQNRNPEDLLEDY